MLYLFDIDGTILLTGGAGSRAINTIFADRYEIAGAMDDIRPDGKTDPGILSEIFESKLGRQPKRDELDDILEVYVPLLRTELGRSNGFRMMPSVHEAIDCLEQDDRVLLGVATGNIQGAAQAKLEHVDLWHRFAIGGYGDDAPDRPGLVARAINRAHDHAGQRIAAHDVIVVGDTVRDIVAARGCGVRVVAVATGATSRDELDAAAPDATLDTLAELPAWHQAQA